MDNTVGQLHSEFRYLDPEIANLLKMFEVDLVLDVGANRGQFSCELIKAGYQGRIMSFEPLSDAYLDLVEVSRNEPRWTVAERCAVGHRSEATILHVAGNSESSSVLPMLASHYSAAPASRYVRSETIMMRRLDEVAAVEVESADRPFLKLDVQGFEHRAIEGAAGILDKIVGLQVELDLTPLYEGGLVIEEMIARLRELGFSLYRLVPGFTDRRSKRMLQVNGIFFRESKDARVAVAGSKAARKASADRSVSEHEIDTFVVIHSQEVLLDCEREGRFAHLPSYEYLFVGSGDVSQVTGFDNVVVARELPDNIEDYQNLLSFTGWYAVAKNNLTRARWVTLLEYDVRLNSDFSSKTLSLLRSGTRLVGYVPFPLSHPMYLHATPWLIHALRETYGIELAQLIGRHLDSGGLDQWNATTNASLSMTELKAFVDWFLPMTRLFRDDPMGAFVQERVLPVFCMLGGLENRLLPDVLNHRQVRSHGLRALSLKEAQYEADKMQASTTGTDANAVKG